MNRFCERCERTTLDGHLWCPDPDCPAENSYPTLSYGDYLGDLKITKVARVWRNAVLYEAQRPTAKGPEAVWVKIAHAGDEAEERLKNEALVLAQLTPSPAPLAAFLQSFAPSVRPVLPVPLAPYPTPSKRPYGEITFRGETKVFSVWRHMPGKFLSDLLLENPQLWHSEAAWLIITVAEALRPLIAKQKCHLALTPDVILVDTDAEGHLRPLLLDLGFLVGGDEMASVVEWARLCEPAYTAPELLIAPRIKTVAPTADVYSLGLIYYEMLAGHPGYEPRLERDARLREKVLHTRAAPSVDRPELKAAGVVKVVEQAIAPANRYTTILEFAAELVKIYGTPPREKRPTPSRTYAVVGAIGAVALITVAVVGYVLWQAMVVGGGA